MTDDAVDAPGLESWLAASLGWAGPRISNQRPLQAGWESDVIAFDVVHASGEHHLVVRLYEGQDAAAKAVREFDGMRELANAGFPVPFVFGAEPDGAVLGRPFLVMEFVAGNAEWTWPEAAASSHFSRLFNELHSLDWRPFAAKLGQGGVEETLEDFRGYLVNAPIPGFEKWLRWLDERLHSVPRLEPSVVHWDYHPGNMLVADDDSLRIIDWTSVAVSDRRFDLAWSGLLMRQSMGTDLLREAYEQHAGSMAEMEFFDLAAVLRRLYSIAVSLEYGPEVLGMRPEAADLMRDQIGSLGPSYEWARDLTGVSIEAVEALLEG